MHRFPCLILAFWAFLLLAGACAKIELPGEEEEEKPPTPVIEEADVLTVAQVIGMEEEMKGYDVAVRGYIVGYIKGSAFSEKGVIFSLPEEVNTNMLLADSKTESDFRKCLPVRLPAATASEDFRGELNLYDHPDLFRRLIVIEGQLNDYFRTMGIKNIWDYYFPATTPEEEDPEEKPDKQEVPFPSLGGTDSVLLEGR